MGNLCHISFANRVIKMQIFILVLLCSTAFLKSIEMTENWEQFSWPGELAMIDLLGLGNRGLHMKQPSTLRNSASKFLLEVYRTIEDDQHHTNNRYKRDTPNNFMTNLDYMEIENCNNMISFSSKRSKRAFVLQPLLKTNTIQLRFNTKDVPKDLKLIHAIFRIYQNPKKHETQPINTTISIYRKNYSRGSVKHEFIIVNSLNTTTNYQGWLDVNITKVLKKWLQHKSIEQTIFGQELFIEISGTLNHHFVTPDMSEDLEHQPFIIGYFNGPELMAKIQKLRFKREILKRKEQKTMHMRVPSNMDIYKMPKTCERLNFTLDFKDLHMQNWVIAPKKFEAYFCGGECNFPLGAHMNATNHAIVQTLMHLKQPNLPKPCCVPTVLGSISILHYLNEDSVNLSKYPQSVAKECGCH